MIDILAALLLGAHALPPVVSPDEETITVTGQRPLAPKAVRRHVADISQTVDGQLARFATPICPQVIGLPAEYGAVVEARIREIAAGARLEVEAKPCAPNLNLIVTTDGAQFIDAARNTLIFGNLETWEIRKLRDSGPVRTWHRTQIVNEDLQGIKNGTLTVRSASIITMPIQQAIMEAFILIDASAVAGKSLVQLADYAALRTLADTRPPRDANTNAETILTLFEPGARAPAQATSLDLAYLHGLYRSAANRRFIQQRARISKLVGRELEAGAPDGRTDNR
jgi:hypothetical protein